MALVKTKRTRKLGKAEERRLHTALSTDDLLYQKFESMRESLRRAEEDFFRRKRVLQVLGRRPGSNLLYDLMILEVHHSPEGMQAIVVLPPEAPIKPQPGFSLGEMKNHRKKS